MYRGNKHRIENLLKYRKEKIKMKETTQNNILLAEFLGWKRETAVRGRNGRTYDFICPEHIEVIGESDSEYCSDCGRDTYRKNYLFGEDLLFHSDWNWLMGVVEKIESLYDGGFDVSILTDGTIIHQYRLTPNDYLCEGKEVVRLTCVEQSFIKKIEHVYNACVQFVKWYNKEKK